MNGLMKYVVYAIVLVMVMTVAMDAKKTKDPQECEGECIYR